MKKILLAAAVLAGSACMLSAKVTLPQIFGDNMVLQQQTSAAVWGTAAPSKTVTITTSWNDSKVTVKAGKDGKWSTTVATPEAGGPYEITFSDGEALTLKNVLIGEVWLCSGQSNMSMPVRGFGGQPVENSAAIIMDAKKSVPIRMCMLGRTPSLKEEADCQTKWKENTPDAVAVQGVVSYLFGKKIQAVLDVPVGIINTSWGGSSIEAWLNEETLRAASPKTDLSHLKGTKVPEKAAHAPACLFNGMVAPLVPFTFRGMIWYQGETNRSRPDEYVILQNAYVNMMRKLFKNENAPFYCVQIAPYGYGKSNETDSGYFTEAQAKSVASLKNAGIATTVDVGEEFCIHPSKKEPVAQRLAMLALNGTYGKNWVVGTAPTYKNMEVKDGKKGKQVIVNFNTYHSNIGPIRIPINGFEVAGADRKFYAAKAVTGDDHKSVVISCPSEVAEPVAVRYCFHNYAPGNLFNDYGVPVGPFRTDDWAK